MSCCHCTAVEKQFGPKRAQHDLERYRKLGPDTTTRSILDALHGSELRNATVLDVGGGIGVLCHELLRAGATSATHVEAASAYSSAAEAEAKALELDDRMNFVRGDFLEVADTISRADIVTLDRVVCCYPEYQELVSLSAARCRRLYALSLPRDRWYVKAVTVVQNRLRALFGSQFRTFVHPERSVEAALEAAGLRVRFDGGTFVWRVAVYVREEGGSGR